MTPREKIITFIQSKDRIRYRYFQDPSKAHELNLRYTKYIGHTLKLNTPETENFLLNQFKKLHPDWNQDIRHSGENEGSVKSGSMPYMSGKISLINFNNNKATSLVTTGGYSSEFGFIYIGNEAIKENKLKVMEFLLSETTIENLTWEDLDLLINELPKESEPSVLGWVGGFSLDRNIITFLLHNEDSGLETLRLLYDIISLGDHDILHDLSYNYYFNHFSKDTKDIQELGKLIETQTMVDYYKVIQNVFTLKPELKIKLIERFKIFLETVNKLNFFNYPQDGSVVHDKKNHLISIYLFFLGRIVYLNDIDLKEIIESLEQERLVINHGGNIYNILEYNKMLEQEYIINNEYIK